MKSLVYCIAGIAYTVDYNVYFSFSFFSNFSIIPDQIEPATITPFDYLLSLHPRTIDLLDWNSLIDDTTKMSSLLMVPNLEVRFMYSTFTHPDSIQGIEWTSGYFLFFIVFFILYIYMVKDAIVTIFKFTLDINKV